MRIEKDDVAPDVLDLIADKVITRLLPVMSGNGKQSGDDTIFDKKALAAYLRVSDGTINRMVSEKQIPYFKIQQGQSGGVRFTKAQVDKWIQRQSIPDINPFTGKIRP